MAELIGEGRPPEEDFIVSVANGPGFEDQEPFGGGQEGHDGGGDEGDDDTFFTERRLKTLLRKEQEMDKQKVGASRGPQKWVLIREACVKEDRSFEQKTPVQLAEGFRNRKKKCLRYTHALEAAGGGQPTTASGLQMKKPAYYDLFLSYGHISHDHIQGASKPMVLPMGGNRGNGKRKSTGDMGGGGKLPRLGGGEVTDVQLRQFVMQSREEVVQLRRDMAQERAEHSRQLGEVTQELRTLSAVLVQQGNELIQQGRQMLLLVQRQGDNLMGVLEKLGNRY